MKVCRCGSYAINDDPAQAFCDKCWRDEKLKTALAALDAAWGLIESIQRDTTNYLAPDKTECGQDWFVSRVIFTVDGPQQRKAEKLRRAVEEKG